MMLLRSTIAAALGVSVLALALPAAASPLSARLAGLPAAPAIADGGVETAPVIEAGPLGRHLRRKARRHARRAVRRYGYGYAYAPVPVPVPVPDPYYYAPGPAPSPYVDGGYGYGPDGYGFYGYDAYGFYYGPGNSRKRGRSGADID